jgi:hypothetical protein
MKKAREEAELEIASYRREKDNEFNLSVSMVPHTHTILSHSLPSHCIL